MAINIRYGTIDEWNAIPDSQKNSDDIVFLTDLPIIKTKGQTYGGNGVPTWSGESCAYSDPTVLFKSIFKALKKPLYLSDETCPKFDIYINQYWTTEYETIGNTRYRYDKWALDNYAYHLYRTHYDNNLTEYSHYTHTGNSGYKVVFTFPIISGGWFKIYECEDRDWLDPAGLHDKDCPKWDNGSQKYVNEYGYEYVDNTDTYTRDHLSKASETDDHIVSNIDGTIQIIYNFGDVISGTTRPYIKIRIV